MVDGECGRCRRWNWGGIWLLSRDHQVSEELESSYLDTAREQGFDLDDWIRPQQSGRVVHV